MREDWESQLVLIVITLAGFMGEVQLIQPWDINYYVQMCKVFLSNEGSFSSSSHTESSSFAL